MAFVTNMRYGLLYLFLSLALVFVLCLWAPPQIIFESFSLGDHSVVGCTVGAPARLSIDQNISTMISCNFYDHFALDQRTCSQMVSNVCPSHKVFCPAPGTPGTHVWKSYSFEEATNCVETWKTFRWCGCVSTEILIKCGFNRGKWSLTINMSFASETQHSGYHCSVLVWFLNSWKRHPDSC